MGCHGGFVVNALVRSSQFVIRHLSFPKVFQNAVVSREARNEGFNHADGARLKLCQSNGVVICRKSKRGKTGFRVKKGRDYINWNIW